MEVKFVQFPEHNVIPAKKNHIGESILYELTSPFNPEKPLSRFYLRCKDCGECANLGDHDEVKIESGLITISPSIQCPVCPAHYFIKNGYIE